MMFQSFNKLCIFVFLMSVTVFYSCNDAQSKGDFIQEVTSFIGKNIQFASLFHDDRNSLDTILWSKRNKIIIYLDSIDCTSCAFNEIRKWNIYTQKLKELNTYIVIICSHPNVKAVRDIKKAVHIDFPIFFDIERNFELINDIPRKTIFQIFVVGTTNQVIWVGLPIRSKKSWEEFCSVIMLSNTNSV